MKKIRYVGPAAPPITLGGPDGTNVTDPEGVVEVDDDLAKTLVSQDAWETAGTPAKTAAPAAKKED